MAEQFDERKSLLGAMLAKGKHAFIMRWQWVRKRIGRRESVKQFHSCPKRQAGHPARPNPAWSTLNQAGPKVTAGPRNPPSVPDGSKSTKTDPIHPTGKGARDYFGPGKTATPSVTQAAARTAPTKVTPSSLGARSIVENARLHRMWEDSIRELHGGSGRTGRALREYLSVIEAGGTPTSAQARNAFNSVRASFARRVETAIQAGEAFPGYSFESIHHRNWHMADHSFHALDPRQLFPVTQDFHELIHLRTTIGPVVDPLDIYFQPINPLHRMDLDLSYPLAPR